MNQAINYQAINLVSYVHPRFQTCFVVVALLLLIKSKTREKMALQNVNPIIYDRAKERILTKEEQDDAVTDKIDEREVFGKCIQSCYYYYYVLLDLQDILM